MKKSVATLFAILAGLLSATLAGCGTPNPNGPKPVWTSHFLPAPPEDGYMSPKLLERPINKNAAIVDAIKRHKTICAETGCPEWTAFIKKKREETAGKNSSYTAWRTHMAFMKNSFTYLRPRIQYGKNYLASPAEFFAADKTGDTNAAALAEFMTFSEIGWNPDDLRYTMLMVGRYYVPVVMVRASDWSNGREHMLYYAHDFRKSPEFYREAALIYSTDGERLWEQEWARNGEYALAATSPSTNRVTGDRTRRSFFY